MSEKETGGPAFPTGETRLVEEMTLRDYFAINADIGDMDELPTRLGEILLSRKFPISQDYPIDRLLWLAEYRSKLRYIEADAMIKARKA